MITADFKKTDIYENIKQQLNGLDIGILGTVCVTVQFGSASRALLKVNEFLLHFVVFFLLLLLTFLHYLNRFLKVHVTILCKL